MKKELFNLSQLQQQYLSLMDELDSPILSDSSKKLATDYFHFAKTLFDSFNNNEFNSLKIFWTEQSDNFDPSKMNIDSIGLILPELDYHTKKQYLKLVLSCQNLIAKTFFDSFAYDLNEYEKNYETIPPFFLFSNWLNNDSSDVISYSNSFYQQHYDLLAHFNGLPELEKFIDTLLFIQPTNWLFNGNPTASNFQNIKPVNINLPYLKTLNSKKIRFDTLLKNNSINLANNLIDYIKQSVHKLDSKHTAQILKNTDFDYFAITYQKQIMESLLPEKNTKNTTFKI